MIAVFSLSGVAGAASTDLVRLPIDVSQAGAGPDTVVVRKGDHLWKIAERHLTEKASSTPVAPYWREVVSHNEPHLRSGDPDLIYPGEVVELPELSERP